VCEYGAVELVELVEERSSYGLYTHPSIRGGEGEQSPDRNVARVNPVLCKGCGACAVVCPTSALQANHFTSGQVSAMIQASLGY
jgi:heterodisulfide reductase subunit A